MDNQEIKAEEIRQLERLAEKAELIRKEIAKVIIGQNEVIEQVLVALLSGGHGLIVGVPGLAKTLMVSTLARILDLKFSRIQFTPDLMPSDITGTEVIEEEKASGKRFFRFVPGPIFANVVLADEINRTPPKTQSALLQAMQEHTVTVGECTYKLEEPFFVLATQNPIEQEGTYPLPEAQLDRFMFEILIDYPSKEEEIEIVKYTTSAYTPEVKKVLTSKEIIELQSLVRIIPVSDYLVEYTVRLVSATRPTNNAPDFVKKYIRWGAGPRAGQYLVLAAKTLAGLDGRPTPSVADVKKMIYPVLRHRIIRSFNAEAEGITTDQLISRLIEVVKE